jgi:hypothetical protein
MPRKTFTFEGRRYDVEAPTERELIAKVALKKRDLEECRKKITKNMLVRDWGEEYIETYKRTSVDNKEYSDIKGRAKNHIYIYI